MVLNATTSLGKPPLPTYNLTPVPPLLRGIPDRYLSPILPIITFWLVSGIFDFLDKNGYFPKYRIHTPAEILKRNRVSKSDVIKCALFQQVMQLILGILLDDSQDFTGDEDYRIAVWATKIRAAQKLIPSLLAVLGVDAKGLAGRIARSHPILAGSIAGGIYPDLTRTVSLAGKQMLTAAFADWEITTAKIIYWVLVPAFQFSATVFLADTWQYFTHRAMHVNKWLYKNIHAMHHRLYAPYAYGAFYNHPLESFVVDVLGLPYCLKLCQLTTRQAMCYYVVWTIKTVNDHAGFAFPWDPFQYLTANTIEYHDLHHQNWGLKYNFCVYLTFWDRVLGTMWTGDASSRYERGRAAAQREVDRDNQKLGENEGDGAWSSSRDSPDATGAAISAQ